MFVLALLGGACAHVLQAHAQDVTTPTTTISVRPSYVPRRFFRAEEIRENIRRHREQSESLTERRLRELRSKLTQFTDQRRRVLVDKINSSLAAVNENRTNAMSHNLEQIGEILNRISIATDDAAEKGIDVTLVNEKIHTAETAIENAENALIAQAAKNYTIVIQSESTVREDIMIVKDQLKTDLKTLHDAVKTAHQAVIEAAITLNRVRAEAAITSTPTP